VSASGSPASGPTPCLKIQDLAVAYDQIHAVRGVSLEVKDGEIVTLIGANGAGKTTILRAISGMVRHTGTISFRGTDLAGVPAHRRVSLGIAHVPEGRGIFSNLTVAENLALATWGRRDRPGIRSDLDRVHTLFPRLRERASQMAGTLSGGEQQMLAVGRALMTGGRLLLLDEPSMGLSPILVREIFQVLREINAAGTTILLVEQNAHLALRLAKRAWVLQNGQVEVAGSAADLAGDPRVRDAYLGG
jgi:branched-chain amino acid transport system ATP-binding protein